MNTDASSFFTLTQAQHHAQTIQDACREATLASRKPLVYSHGTTLGLYGMNVALDTSLNPRLLHVTVGSQREKSRHQGLQYHMWNNEMTTSYIDEMVASVSVQQAICQIAPYTTQDSLTMAMDRLTCHNDDLRQTTHRELSDYISRLSRFTGSSNCKKALERSVDGTDSPQETLLRLRLIDRGLPCPAVNYPIHDPVEGKILTVDMAYVDERVAIEYDGEYHYTMQRWSYDIHKRNRIVDLGWKVFTADKKVFSSEQALNAFIHMVLNAMGKARNSIHIYGHAG